MIDVVCFCGSQYSFDGEVGACPQCGEYTSLGRPAREEERQMRDELHLMLTRSVTDVLAPE